jgi:hypothetical protein
MLGRMVDRCAVVLGFGLAMLGAGCSKRAPATVQKGGSEIVGGSASGPTLGSPPWPEGARAWESIADPLVGSLQAFLSRCSETEKILNDEGCVSLAAEISKRAADTRRQLPAITAPSDGIGWRTTVDAALEELEEGARVAASGIQARSVPKLNRATQLIVGAAETMRAAPSPSDPLPAEADQQAKDFWTRRDFVLFDDRAQCPGSYWTLTDLVRPGDDEFERRESDSRAAALRAAARGRTYVVRLKKVPGVLGAFQSSKIDLGPYDFDKKQFPLSVGTEPTCGAGEETVATVFSGARRDSVVYWVSVSPNAAKELRTAWDDALVYFDLAFEPAEKPDRDGRVVGRVKAVRMFVNAQPVLALFGEAARPWETGRTKREKAPGNR